jgi:hypothetical protein
MFLPTKVILKGGDEKSVSDPSSGQDVMEEFFRSIWQWDFDTLHHV